jgi:hypothetical protein
LRVSFKKSETNQFGKQEQGGCLRYLNIYIWSLNIELCPVSAVAFYLLNHFDIDKNTWPKFSSNEDWYNLYLFGGTNALTYRMQALAIKEAIITVGVNSKDVTHLGRKMLHWLVLQKVR